jgi:hypothetical protein
MASHRPYQPASGVAKAFEEITENKGKRASVPLTILGPPGCLLLAPIQEIDQFFETQGPWKYYYNKKTPTAAV